MSAEAKENAVSLCTATLLSYDPSNVFAPVIPAPASEPGASAPGASEPASEPFSAMFNVPLSVHTLYMWSTPGLAERLPEASEPAGVPRVIT